MTTGKKSAREAPTSIAYRGLKRNVVPDRIDLRDRIYNPSIAIVPGETLESMFNLPVLNQGETNACTGFALASVVYALQRSARRPMEQCKVSPYMLYSMARRYDEFPGDPNADTGSSLRGAMKGWYKHGVCSNELWKTEAMPTNAAIDASADWWLDAVRRPLGAYYRIDSRSIADMHVALNEIGILYASAVCHEGWSQGFNAPPSRRKGTYWTIPRQKADPFIGGHAFVIIGYNHVGFIIHNSWGKNWGTGGRAILLYEDWLDNAMDCWVAQLGVVTELREEIARSTTLRVHDGIVRLASDAALRRREISPFILDMENNGRLSNTGDFRTQDSDVTALVNDHLGKARATWGLSKNDPTDIAIYAHGGLTSEDTAAETAAKWIPALYQNKIFPIFLMWETDLWSTLKGRLKDLVEGQPRPSAGLPGGISRWWNERLEKLLSIPGTAIWGEMKQNANAISSDPFSGGIKLYQECCKSRYFDNMAKVRLHLIGHSAGSIVHSHIIHRLCARGWIFESLNLLAPAVDLKTFEETAVPALRSGQVKRFNEFHLTDDMELRDTTCQSLFGYGHSLLYLVSRSFEKGQNIPILGMDRYFKNAMESWGCSNVHTYLAPGMESKSTTHGGFDDDAVTMNSVIARILNK